MRKNWEVIAGLLWLVLAGGAVAQDTGRTQAQTWIKAQAQAQAQGAHSGHGPDALPTEMRPRAVGVASWRALAEAALAEKRAGSDTVANNMDVAGTVSSNVASNVVSGANAISAGSFANAAGLPVAIQNSGANVLIQNATIINVQMR